MRVDESHDCSKVRHQDRRLCHFSGDEVIPGVVELDGTEQLGLVALGSQVVSHLKAVYGEEPIPEVLDPGLVFRIQLFGDSEAMEVKDGGTVGGDHLSVLDLFRELPISCSLQNLDVR